MIRRSLYKGGDLGIRNRDAATRDILRIFAKSDFMHDFGEGVETRDKYTQADTERFLEIAQRFGISKVKALIGGFNEVIGKNPYMNLKEVIHTQIYPDHGTDEEYLNEVSVMKRIGLDYTVLKDSIKYIREGRSESDLLKNPPRIENATYSFAGQTRTYDITAVPLKNGDQTVNIATAFHHVTGGKKKFAMVIDAAGGLSMTSVRNADLEPYVDLGAEKFEFYIIENIENASDSATKLKNIDKPKSRDNVNLFFLKDVPKTVVYYPFENRFGSQGENLYGNARLVLSRTEEDTEADFYYEGNESYHIENVSQNANVKNASLNLLAAKLANRGREAYMYPYLKRVGDWCQALSLLDTTREYVVLDANHNPVDMSGRSLKDIAADGELALVTLDRILLAYALILGINVFFTTGSDLGMLLYFKNKEIQLTPEEIAAKTAMLYAEYTELKKQDYEDNTMGILSKITAFVKDETVDDVVYLRRLRSALSNMSTMRFSFSSIWKDILAAESKFENPDPMIVYTAAYDAISLRKRYLVDKAHNIALASSIYSGVYPDFVLEKQYYDTFTNGRPSRNAIFKMKEIISKKMYDDVLQVKKVFADYGVLGHFSGLFRAAKNPSMTDVFEAFRPIWLSVNVLTGGGAEEVASSIEALKQFTVRPVTESEYEELYKRPDAETIEDENTLILIRGKYYRDEKSNTYTVLDEYLITEEDLGTFDIIRSHITEDTPHLPFLALRYILLYSDMLNARYERLSENEEIQEGVESDVNLAEHKRIHVETAQLFDIMAEIYRSKSKNYLVAFDKALILMKDSQKWSADTIQLYIDEGGVGYYIYNNYFRETATKIRNIRELVEKLRYPSSIAKKVDSGKPRVTAEERLTRGTSVKARALSKNRRRKDGGGLEERRPLYSNDPQRPTLPHEPELNEGLRERTWTRRTRRVRKQSGKSRRR